MRQFRTVQQFFNPSLQSLICINKKIVEFILIITINLFEIFLFVKNLHLIIIA